MIGEALVLAYSSVTRNDHLIECVLVNLASAVQFHYSTLPVDFSDGCHATAACLPDDLAYYMMPLLLALRSRDRLRLAGFLSDNRQVFLCRLFSSRE
jgi:hypothetical protein